MAYSVGLSKGELIRPSLMVKCTHSINLNDPRLRPEIAHQPTKRDLDQKYGTYFCNIFIRKT